MTFTAQAPEFLPHPLMRNPHVMTIGPAFLIRRLDPAFKAADELRIFQVEPGSAVLAHCHWQPNRKQCTTLIVIHGLGGSADSSHVIALAQKAFASGFNTIRLNLRNCGGGMSLTKTLYNAGLSKDLIQIINELNHEGYEDLFVAGFSLGGNITLKAAGELGTQAKKLLKGVAAISPAINLDLAVHAIEQPRNRIYEMWFLRTLKDEIRRKERLFPGTFDTSQLASVNTLRRFDDVYTAPDGGYGNVDNYYLTASSQRVIDNISIPTLIIASHDDPLVPFSMFEQPALQNPNVTLLTAKYGGHAGFVHRYREDGSRLDRFWAENRIVSFCQELKSITQESR